MKTTRSLVAAGAVALALSPLLVSALSVSDLQTQIQNLLAQISSLQNQGGALPAVSTTSVINIPTGSTVTASVTSSVPTPANSVTCPVFNFTFSRGSSGEAVTALQKFLLAHGLLNADSVTGFYGALTEGAVRNFQTQQGIVSSGDATTTGWGKVGKATSAAIVRVCSSGASAAPAATTPTTPTACTAIALVCPVGEYDKVGPNCSHSCVIGTPALAAGSCPLAPPPATLCSVGWVAVKDAYSCTTSYTCSVPLPPVATTSAPAVFFATPASGSASLFVTFSTASMASDIYSINFGDGFVGQMFVQTCTNSSGTTSCVYQLGHTYVTRGTFTPVLSGGRVGQMSSTSVTVR